MKSVELQSKEDQVGKNDGERVLRLFPHLPARWVLTRRKSYLTNSIVLNIFTSQYKPETLP
jgi:hypothetical protein